MTTPLVLSQTGINTFLSCRMKWHWAYEENLARSKPSMPLQVGGIVHKLLHLYYTHKLNLEWLENLSEHVQVLYPTNEIEFSEDVAYEAGQLFLGYVRKYENDPFEVVSSETTLEVDLGYCILHARIDLLVRNNDRLRRVEHKTAKKTNAAYLQGLTRGLQNALYDFASNHLLGEQIDGTLFNLIVKTQIPQYTRQFVPYNQGYVDRALRCVEGVANDIKAGNFYPSCRCFEFNRECEYSLLCMHDSPTTRNAFYTKRKEVIEDDLANNNDEA